MHLPGFIHPDIGNNGDLLQSLDGELGGWIERADRFDMIAGKFDPEGMVMAEGENINQTSPERKLPGFGDEVGPVKIVFNQQVEDKIHVNHLPNR